MFRSFFTTIFRGSSAVFCAVTIPPADLRSLSSYYTVCSRMCMSSVIQHFLRIISTTFMISRIWKVRHLIRRKPDLPGYHEHRGNFSKELLYYRWHTHAATYCVIRTQRTEISGRSSNGTKHSGGPPENGSEKRPKHVEVLYLQTRF